MYISLAWKPRDGADPADVERAIGETLATLRFANVYSPMAGFLYANTPGNTKTRVDDLQTALRALPVTFAISATLRGWLMWRSADVPSDICERIADYED